MIPPTIEQVLHALEKEKKNKWLDVEEDFALQYHRRRQNDAEYMRKFNDAREIIAARRSSVRYQPLMPIMPSHFNKNQNFRSPSSRYDRQRQTAASTSVTPRRSLSSSEWQVYGRQRHTSPSNFSKHHRSRSPNIPLVDQNQSSSGILNTGTFEAHVSFNSSLNRSDHEQFNAATEDSYHTTVSASPVMEKSRFYSRAKRSPTPINDNHIVDDDYDWNSNSHASQNNNATPSASASNSQSEQQLDEPAPFIMGTLKNIDNSCYMNSLLYILRMTPTFVHSIHHLRQNMLCLCDEIDDSIDVVVTPDECLQLVATSVMMSNREKWPNDLNINESQKKVILQLHRIFSKLTAREKHLDDEPLEKKRFQEAVRAIAPYFTEGRQEDAHEFLLIILNCIRDCGAFLTELTQKHAGIFEKYV